MLFLFSNDLFTMHDWIDQKGGVENIPSKSELMQAQVTDEWLSEYPMAESALLSSSPLKGDIKAFRWPDDERYGGPCQNTVTDYRHYIRMSVCQS